MTVKIDVRVQGIESLRRKLHSETIAQPVRDFLRRIVLMIQREVQEKTPVDTGRLRASITTQVDSAPFPQWGQVGTNVRYAPAVEFGTAPHVVTEAEIGPWARRHNVPVWVVINAIARAGTKPHFMFTQAANWARETISRNVRQLAQDIERTYKAR